MSIFGMFYFSINDINEINAKGQKPFIIFAAKFYYRYLTGTYRWVRIFPLYFLWGENISQGKTFKKFYLPFSNFNFFGESREESFSEKDKKRIWKSFIKEKSTFSYWKNKYTIYIQNLWILVSQGMLFYFRLIPALFSLIRNYWFFISGIHLDKKKRKRFPFFWLNSSFSRKTFEIFCPPNQKTIMLSILWKLIFKSIAKIRKEIWGLIKIVSQINYCNGRRFCMC